MPLINLQTNLKSLKYGRDRFNGGDSGQPYIQTNIPDEISPYIGTTDFLLRGGLRAVQDSVVDVERLGKMFDSTKSPNGILFTAKQQLLSRTAVRTQTSGILNEGVYTPLSTLAQAGLVAFGNHLNKQGIDPFANTGAFSTNTNLYQNKVTPSQLPKDNRLVRLAGGVISKEPTKINNITLTSNSPVDIMTYGGGPGSDLGIGKTAIRYSPTSKTFLTQNPGDSIYGGIIKSPFYFGANYCYVYSSQQVFNPYTTIGNRNGISSSPEAQVNGQNQIQNHSNPKIQDFRRIIRNNLKDINITKIAADSGVLPDNSFSETDVTYGISYTTDPGQRAGKSYANYVKGVTNSLTGKSVYNPYNTGFGEGSGTGTFYPGLDAINSVPVYRSEQATPNLPDYVQFRIAIIDNDAPSFKTFIHFRAFIDSMSDSYTADWTPFKYLGRGENFYNYQGFSRQISLSWTVAAQSKEELIIMYKKLNYLASSLTPDYSPKGYMRGNLAQLTVGGYLYEQPGIITSLTYDIPEESPWEIASDINGLIGGDGTVKQLPHIIKVTGFNFIPIQRFRPSIQDLTFKNTNNTDNTLDDRGFINTYGPQHYISLANSFGNNYDNYNTNPIVNTIVSQNNEYSFLPGEGPFIP